MALDLSHIQETVANLRPSLNESEITRDLEVILAAKDEWISAHIDNAYLKNENLNLQNDKINEEIHTLRADRNARKIYGIAIFGFVALYIFAVMCTIWYSAKISDAVLMTLLGSTSINIIGLLMGVVRYLFPQLKK